MPTSWQSTGRLTWTLVLLCVALALLVGLAVAFDEDGDLGLPLCADEDAAGAPEEAQAVPLAPAARRPLVSPSACPRLACLRI